MRKLLKELTCCVLAGAMIVGGNFSTAKAATKVTGKIESLSISGSLSVDSSSATATTIFYGSGGNRTATASVYYWYGSLYYCTSASNYSVSGGGVSATATKKLGGSEVVGGTGAHTVTYKGYTWSGATTKGTIPSTYKTL